MESAATIGPRSPISRGAASRARKECRCESYRGYHFFKRTWCNSSTPVFQTESGGASPPVRTNFIEVFPPRSSKPSTKNSGLDVERFESSTSDIL